MAKDRHDPGTLDIEEWSARNPSPADSRDHQHPPQHREADEPPAGGER